MKAYMGYSACMGSEEGAILIFANNLKEARRIGFYELLSLGICEDWIDCRVRWIKEADHLFYMADKVKLENGVANIVDDPDVCESCGMWGGVMRDGVCSYCTELE
jgi:hypothetical protein